MIVKNKELIQSYIFTTAKYDFHAYEKRILYRIVERLQYLIKDKKLSHVKYPVQEGLFGEKTFTFDVADFLNGEESKNHTRIKKALKSLRDKTFEYDDGKIWEYLGIIEAPSIKHYEKTVSFKVEGEKKGLYISKKAEAMIYAITIIQNDDLAKVKKGAIKFVNYVFHQNL